MSFPHAARHVLPFVALFLLLQRFRFLLLLVFELLLPLAQLVCVLLTLVLVRVGDLIQVYVFARHEALDLPSQNFLDARKAEEKEGVGNLPDVQLAEGKDERELVFLVVAQEAHEGVLRLVHQVFVF